MGDRKANPVDIAVGRRIRLYRMNAKLSQTELGNHIGVTFQQVQKYEKGANRVGAGRLTQIAAILNVPITAFFKDVASGPKNFAKHDSVSELLAAPRAFKLLQAFSGIADLAVQAAILDLVEAIRRRSERQRQAR
jgi:transcriptional regulator with XRE-family HTH domain